MFASLGFLLEVDHAQLAAFGEWCAVDGRTYHPYRRSGEQRPTLGPLLCRAGNAGFGYSAETQDVSLWQLAGSALVALAGAVLLQLAGGLFLGLLVPQLFGSLGETAVGSSTADIGAALMAMYETAASRFNSNPETIQSTYTVLIFLWAAFGEELFYRGYMHGTLAKRTGVRPAMLLSAGFFAVRHGTQLLLLWPDYPVIASLAWMTFSFAFGLVMSYLYERHQSLTFPLLIHFVFNAIPLLAG